MIFAILLWMFGGAMAQSVDYSMNIENFRPASDPFGYTVTDGASTLGNLNMGVGFWWSHSDDPLVLMHEGQRVLSPIDFKDGVIDQRNTVDLQVGIGISKYFSLSLDLPAVLWQSGFRPEVLPLEEVDVESSGLSDLRIAPKVVFLRTGEDSPVGLAIVARLMIPTAMNGSYMGEESVTFQPVFIAEVADGSVIDGDYKVRFAINAGALIRDQFNFRGLTIDETFEYRAALGLRPIKALELGVDAAGWVGGKTAVHRPVEILPWIKLHPAAKASITAGAGFGLNEGIGNPDFRFFVGATLAPSVNPEELDRDKDGVPNKYDQCPYEMEDLDGFKDDDGCPDPDNDGDGILDGDDACPNEAETVNGYLDEDGCPDTLPAGDTDGDGLDDSLDKCPLDQEDFDGFEDEDGCPDRDNDLDGILDVDDQCPLEKEVFNGFEDEDGCPDEGQARVYIERSRIVIKDKIFFETNKSVIKSESFSLLNEIAELILSHDELRMIRVEGHTDSDGGDTYNLDLSQARAEAVVTYLVGRGVVKERLDPAGFGKRRPIADNTTPEGKSKNRRVEFLIIDKE